jgi:DNA helicase-2/ATP-dependent DNA helicase PcrA
MTLTSEQQQFVDHKNGGHARLLAGPGTGKSFTSVAYLEGLGASGQRPRCHMITFTRAATKELQQKFSSTPHLTVRPPSTAHSFAMRILMRETGAGSVRMADDWEKRHLIEEMVKVRMAAANHRVTITDVQELTSEMAAGWEALDGDRLRLVGRDPALAAAFIGAWTEAQGQLQFLHVSEVPYRALELLQDRTIDVELDVLVVDEYQDLNRAEVGIIEQLSKQCAVIAIGDDDQSIYGWRHAAPDALLAFCGDFTAPSYLLSTCYRCPPEILDPANQVIAAATGRGRKPSLQARGGRVGTFAQLRFPTSAAEFDGVAEIIEARIRQGVDPNEIAVLVRSSREAYRKELEPRLAARGVKLTSTDWVDAALEESEVRRVLALGRLVDEETDSLAWLALLKHTKGVGATTLGRLYQEACDAGVAFSTYLEEQRQLQFPTLGARARKLVTESVAAAHRVVSGMRGEVQGATLGAGGWGAWLLQQGDTSAISPEASHLFREVGGLLMDEPEPSLSAFINQLQAEAKNLAESAPDAVRLMSMAQSKGLTVNSTILLGVDDDTLPSPKASSLEEERRILYVAMTRATDFSVITFAERRTGATGRVGKAGRRRSRSRFLSRLPGVSGPQDGPSFAADALAAASAAEEQG